ncbi:MAG TPA: MCE family protein [Jatrophihabitans sp.]|nr:MCE family protein [Jatrophihabitans sp.]
MSRRALRGLGPTLVKSAVFIVVTTLATALLAVSIANTSGGGRGYVAEFTDATALNSGDDVRMAGVRIGQVQSVSVTGRRLARVRFTVDGDVRLARSVTAAIRYRNLVGQRYLALDQGDGSPDDQLPAGSTIGLDRTQPALDLTALFNGFQPLFQALDPQQVNQLSYEVIEVFQGEGGTIADLVNRTASLTTTLAGKDQVIGQVIDNLNSVLTTVNSRGDQLADLVITLQQLVSGLAADRQSIGSAITGIDGLTRSVGGLLEQGRQPLQQSIDSLGALSGNLAAQSPALNSFLQTLPVKLDQIGRLGSYGSWMNFYLCSVTGRIPVPGEYTGGVGAKPVEARCHA